MDENKTTHDDVSKEAVIPKEVTDSVALNPESENNPESESKTTQEVTQNPTQPDDVEVETASPTPTTEETKSVAPEAPKKNIPVEEHVDTDNKQDKLLASVATSKGRGGKKHVLVISLAVLIMLTLVGGAVYAYLQSSTEPINSGADSQTIRPESDSETNSPDTVEQVDAEIDESLEALEKSSDLDDDDLSDESLGL